MDYLCHRQLIEGAIRAMEPRAVVSLDMRGMRWVISLPLGNGQSVTCSFPAAPVAELEHAHLFYPRRVLHRMIRPWAVRGLELHHRACAHRAELALLG